VEPVSLIGVCLTAFAVVFLVLAVLAAAMHLITLAFPDRTPASDAAVVAAVSAAVAALVPGARVTQVEEES
jgi:multidrug resistance efflux pump